MTTQKTHLMNAQEDLDLSKAKLPSILQATGMSKISRWLGFALSALAAIGPRSIAQDPANSSWTLPSRGMLFDRDSNYTGSRSKGLLGDFDLTRDIDPKISAQTGLLSRNGSQSIFGDEFNLYDKFSELSFFPDLGTTPSIFDSLSQSYDLRSFDFQPPCYGQTTCQLLQPLPPLQPRPKDMDYQVRESAWIESERNLINQEPWRLYFHEKLKDAYINWSEEKPFLNSSLQPGHDPLIDAPNPFLLADNKTNPEPTHVLSPRSNPYSFPTWYWDNLPGKLREIIQEGRRVSREIAGQSADIEDSATKDILGEVFSLHPLGQTLVVGSKMSNAISPDTNAEKVNKARQNLLSTRPDISDKEEVDLLRRSFELTNRNPHIGEWVRRNYDYTVNPQRYLRSTESQEESLRMDPRRRRIFEKWEQKFKEDNQYKE